MFSGGDSGNFSNFQQNVAANASIDWAQIAQEWIKMRDSSSVGVGDGNGYLPEAPPPPNISNNYAQPVYNVPIIAPLPKARVGSRFDEKGEADMDMDDDEEYAQSRNASPKRIATAHAMSVNASGIAAWPINPTLTVANLNLPTATTVLPNAAAAWNAWPTRMTVPNAVATAAATIAAPLLNATANPHIPALMKINVQNPNVHAKPTPAVAREHDNHQSHTSSSSSSSSFSLDAAKRKVLPAWIREGLEKMEKEKQKQMEREHNHGGSNSTNSVNSDALNVLLPNKTGNALYEHVNMLNSKQNAMLKESDNSDSENDESTAAAAAEIDDDDVANDDRQHKKRNQTEPIFKAQFHKYNENMLTTTTSSSSTTAQQQQHNYNAVDEEDHEARDEDDDEMHAQTVGSKTYEQKLADLMIAVRRNLTELLLEVTNAELATIMQESLKAHMRKASSAQVIRKSALNSLTNKLGLAAYDDSSNDEDDANSDASDDARQQHSNEDSRSDTEEQLRSVIRQKRRAFAKVSEQIEEKITANAQREEQKLKYYTQLEQRATNDHSKVKSINQKHATTTTKAITGKQYERDFGEATSTSTDTKLQHSNASKRQKERHARTTRFSDNKDTKHTSMAAYMSQQLQQSVTAATAAAAAAAAAAANTSRHSGNKASSSSSSTAIYNNAATAHLPAETNYGNVKLNAENNALNAVLEQAMATVSKSTSQYLKAAQKKQTIEIKNSKSQHADAETVASSSSSSSTSSSDSKYRRRRHKRDDKRHSSSRSTSYRHTSSSKHVNRNDKESYRERDRAKTHEREHKETSSRREKEKERKMEREREREKEKLKESERKKLAAHSSHKSSHRHKTDSADSSDSEHNSHKRQRTHSKSSATSRTRHDSDRHRHHQRSRTRSRSRSKSKSSRSKSRSSYASSSTRRRR